MKLLLERNEVDPGGASKSCQAPLFWAARNSHEGIVELLLGRKDVNPDSSCESGRILLSSAATNRH